MRWILIATFTACIGACSSLSVQQQSTEEGSSLSSHTGPGSQGLEEKSQSGNWLKPVVGTIVGISVLGGIIIGVSRLLPFNSSTVEEDPNTPNTPKPPPKPTTSPLLEAIKEDKPNRNDILTAQAVDLDNVQDQDGNTALHLACQKGDISLVQELLKRPDLDPNILNEEGESPLFIATKNITNPQLIETLLNNERVDPNLKKTNSNRDTPFQRIIEHNHTDLAKAFLNNPRFVYTTESAYIPLYGALLVGNYDLAKTILDHTAQREEDPKAGTPHNIISPEDAYIVPSIYVRHYRSMNNPENRQYNSSSPSYVAVAKGDQTLFDFLIAHGLFENRPITAQSRHEIVLGSPLRLAIVKGYKKMANAIIALEPAQAYLADMASETQGQVPNESVRELESKGSTTLQLAVSKGYGKVVKAIFDALTVDQMTRAVHLLNSKKESLMYTALLSSLPEDIFGVVLNKCQQAGDSFYVALLPKPTILVDAIQQSDLAPSLLKARMEAFLDTFQVTKISANYALKALLTAKDSQNKTAKELAKDKIINSGDSWDAIYQRLDAAEKSVQ